MMLPDQRMSVVFYRVVISFRIAAIRLQPDSKIVRLSPLEYFNVKVQLQKMITLRWENHIEGSGDALSTGNKWRFGGRTVSWSSPKTTSPKFRCRGSSLLENEFLGTNIKYLKVTPFRCWVFPQMSYESQTASQYWKWKYFRRTQVLLGCPKRDITHSEKGFSNFNKTFLNLNVSQKHGRKSILGNSSAY